MSKSKANTLKLNKNKFQFDESGSTLSPISNYLILFFDFVINKCMYIHTISDTFFIELILLVLASTIRDVTNDKEI